MSRKTKHHIFIYSILIGTLLFYYYGRSIWHSVYLKIRGKNTIEDVYKIYGKKAESRLISYFRRKNIPYSPVRIMLVALKEERLLELWAQHNHSFSLIKIYPFTGFSGKLGPKLQSGDYQIPEGVYQITFLNPNSRFHLSMKINYPNQFDVQKAEIDKRTNLGGDIFIHGKSSTIGCIPIGDTAIEELFTLVYRIGKENVNVIIAPYDMRIKHKNHDNSNIPWLDEKYQNIRNKFNELFN